MLEGKADILGPGPVTRRHEAVDRPGCEIFGLLIDMENGGEDDDDGTSGHDFAAVIRGHVPRGGDHDLRIGEPVLLVEERIDLALNGGPKRGVTDSHIY